MGLLPLIVAAVVILIGAWLVNSLVGLLSGEQPESLGSSWWDFFSKMGSRSSSCAEPLPDFINRRFNVGDKIRVLQVPLEMEQTISRERQELLQRCVGKVLRVEGIDEFGGLELHVLDDGTQAPDRCHHIVYIEPQYAEIVAKQ